MFALRHRPLADHFAGDDEIETVFLHPLLGLVDHEDLTVQARVQIGAVTVFGIEQHLFVFFDDIDDVQLDTELLGHPQRVVTLDLVGILLTDGVGVAFDAKPGKKIDAFDMDALVHDGLAGQHGIQAAGNQRHGFSLLTHNGRD